jgi:hypothetical protein
MKKRLLAFLIWVGIVGVAVAQSVNGVSPSLLSVDGSNVTAAKVLTFPQVQPTLGLNASPTPSPFPTQTPQISNWFPMNGNGAALFEFSSNTLAASYQIQVSDNPTPVTTPGTNIYTAVQDTATYASGGQGEQTKNWSYFIREGFKWFRLLVTQETTNTGTLNVQVRLFGNPPAGDAARSYTSGVPWKQSDVLAAPGSTASAVTYYYDYKVPQGAHGFDLYSDLSAVSGATTLTVTINKKDPGTGQLIALGGGAQIIGHAAVFADMTVNAGYGSPYPIATPVANTCIFSQAVPEDIVVEDAFTGTGTSTYSQTAVPIQ